MKLSWGLILPIILGAGAFSCGQSASDGGSPPVTTGGAGTGPAGSAGMASTSGGAGAPASGTSGSSGAAGSAGSSAGSGGVAGGSGGASAGSGGAMGGGAGSGCSAPGTICWDFETGQIPTGWGPSTRTQDFKGDLLVDNTKAHKGMYALHAKDFTGGSATAGVQGGPKKTIVYTLPPNFGPMLWGRAWVFTHTSSNMSPASHSGLFNARYARPGTTDTDITKLDWYEVASYTQKYMAVWHPPEPPGYPEWVKVSATPVVMDDWACWEWQFDGQNGTEAQAADPRMWVNGTEMTWPAPFVFSDPATTTRPTQEKVTNFTMLETGLYFYQGQPDTENLWIDDLAIGKERIGCQ